MELGRRRRSAGCERVQDMEDEKGTKMLGESDTTCVALYSRESKARNILKGL